MEGFTFVKLDNMHVTILNYIKDNNIKIVEYEDMKECILKMIREKYIFNINRDRLRDAMEDLTYMFSPNDEINKDRVNKGLEYEYSDDEDDDEYDDDEDDDDLSDLEGIEDITRVEEVESSPDPVESSPDPVESSPDPVESSPDPVESSPDPVESSPEPLSFE